MSSATETAADVRAGRRSARDVLDEHLARGYELVYSPHIGKASLWQTSGHLDFYRENMYDPMDVDGQEYFAKPMNCPFHIQVFTSATRSYRDLPIRLTEMGTVYRYERGGVLHGLMRVRGFTQDDAHIFCRPDQVEDEIVGVVEFAFDLLRTFGFDEFDVYLATKPEKAVGDDAAWEHATESLRNALDRVGVDYEVDEGGGAFYGPKLDIKIRDAIGRSWQCTTIQFDFNLPERFDMKYDGADGAEHRPYMVHRALFGSLERFFGVLIEHYGGAFPTWLAPVQAEVIPIADRHIPYAEEVRDQLVAAGLRVHVDGRNERMNAKIRDAQLQKVPYMLVVGDREAEAKGAAVRLRSGEDLGTLPVADVLARIQAEVLGYAATADAHHITSPSPGGTGAVRAARRALEKAKLGADAIDMVSAHATSTPGGDPTELEAINTIVGDRASEVPCVAGRRILPRPSFGGIGGRQGAVRHRHPAAECDGCAAHGARAEHYGPGRPDPLAQDAGPRVALGSGHGPRGDRDPERRRAAVGRRGAASRRPRTGALRREGVGLRHRDRGDDPRATQGDRRVV